MSFSLYLYRSPIISVIASHMLRTANRSTFFIVSMSLQPASHILLISLHPRCLPSNLIQTLIEEYIEFLSYLISSIPSPILLFPLESRLTLVSFPPKNFSTSFTCSFVLNPFVHNEMIIQLIIAAGSFTILFQLFFIHFHNSSAPWG